MTHPSADMRVGEVHLTERTPGTPAEPVLDIQNPNVLRVGHPDNAEVSVEIADPVGPWGFKRPPEISKDAMVAGLRTPQFHERNLAQVMIHGGEAMNFSKEAGLLAAQLAAGEPLQFIAWDGYKFRSMLGVENAAIAFADPPTRADEHSVKVAVHLYGVRGSWLGPAKMQVSHVGTVTVLCKTLKGAQLPSELRLPTLPTPANQPPGAKLWSLITPRTPNFTPAGYLDSSVLIYEGDNTAYRACAPHAPDGHAFTTASASFRLAAELPRWFRGMSSPPSLALFARVSFGTPGTTAGRVDLRAYAFSPWEPDAPPTLAAEGEFLYATPRRDGQPVPMINLPLSGCI